MEKRVLEAKKLGFKNIISPNEYKNIENLYSKLFNNKN